jgi:alkylated DNA nucleotide flippase Atl1
VSLGVVLTYGELQVQVRETTLQELISGMKQFRVPLFQRTYTWSERDHRALWRDIMAQYEAMLPETGPTPAGSGHFIGSFVLAPTPAPATLPAFLVVDGQQRLTTLTLALCALREAAAMADDTAFDRITHQYLINPYAQDSERWKLIPTDQDQKSYFACVEGAHAVTGNDAISAAFRFFEAQLTQPGPDDKPLDLDLLERVIVSKLVIVDITAQEGDNVHRIFESLNATGVGLSQGDLLRNYVFMLLPTRGRTVYEQVWLPMQDLIGTENLEGLARVDLRRRGLDVRDDGVYRAQQQRLEPLAGDEAAIEAEIRDLAVRAGHYLRILRPEAEDDPEIRRHLEFLKRWKATTTHPVAMYLFDKRDAGTLTDDEFAEALRNLEGFLVRRLLVGAATANLNRIFLQLVAHLRDHEGQEPVLDLLRYHLSTERKYWATDTDLRAAAKSKPFYFYGRAEQRRMILERIEESYGHREQADLRHLKLSVEHILPQSLSAEWIQALGAEEDNPNEVHRQYVHTLGNLTLTAYNAELSNHPFERKQQIYGDSHLSLNRDLLDQEGWGRAEIEARADELAERAIDIWPGPVPGVADSGAGFDWARTDAAIAAIPDGRWTSLADLAALAGTAPQVVAEHVAASPHLPKVWRILNHDGQPTEISTSADQPAAADRQEVLATEGVEFNEQGRADPSQRLTVDDLQTLIAWFDDDDDERN